MSRTARIPGHRAGRRSISRRAAPFAGCRFAVLTFAFVLLGCAAPGTVRDSTRNAPHAPTSRGNGEDLVLWRLSDLAKEDHPAILLRSSKGIHGAMETGTARRLLAIAERIVSHGGEGPRPEIALIASRQINAYAFMNEAEPTIAITQGMIGLLAADDEAWAALFGHELAHLRLDHLRRQNDRQQSSEVASSLAGVVLSALGLPFASIATDTTAVLARRAFSRDDEREADEKSLGYLRAAGYSLAGAVRLQEKLLTLEANSGLPFLSTHPSGTERIENLRSMVHSGN